MSSRFPTAPSRTMPETNPPEAEVITAAMLMGQHPPVRCFMCMGLGRNKRLFGAVRCTQCEGLGWDIISPEMREWVTTNRR